MVRRTADDFTVEMLAARTETVSVCVPALDEEATIAGVVRPFAEAREQGLVDQVVVADSGSTDATAARAREAGADVLDASGDPRGKGDTVRRALPSLTGELLVFVDADLQDVDGRYLRGLVGPLLDHPEVQLVKAAFRRPGAGGLGGGRVTELLAKPLLARCYPELAALAQPLSGQIGVRADWMRQLDIRSGYGLEMGMVLDTYRRLGLEAFAEVDIGVLHNAHQEIDRLSGMALEVLDVVLHHLAAEGRYHTA